MRGVSYSQDAEAVQGSYDLDDLDDEWKELLGQIDAAFLTVIPASLCHPCRPSSLPFEFHLSALSTCSVLWLLSHLPNAQ
jgi:hypothetical protein